MINFPVEQFLVFRSINENGFFKSSKFQLNRIQEKGKKARLEDYLTLKRLTYELKMKVFL